MGKTKLSHGFGKTKSKLSKQPLSQLQLWKYQNKLREGSTQQLAAPSNLFNIPDSNTAQGRLFHMRTCAGQTTSFRLRCPTPWNPKFALVVCETNSMQASPCCLEFLTHRTAGSSASALWVWACDESSYYGQERPMQRIPVEQLL